MLCRRLFVGAIRASCRMIATIGGDCTGDTGAGCDCSPQPKYAANVSATAEPFPRICQDYRFAVVKDHPKEDRPSLIVDRVYDFLSAESGEIIGVGGPT